MFDLKCITKKASFFSALPSLEFSKRIYEPIPSHCLLLICCACTDNKNPHNSTRSATGAIREEQKSKRPKVCSDLRMKPEIRGATMYRPDGRIIVFLHHHRVRFLLFRLWNQPHRRQPQWNLIHTGVLEENCADLLLIPTKNSLETSILSTRPRED